MAKSTQAEARARRVNGDRFFLSMARGKIKRPMLDIGTKIDRFEVKKHLGSGSLADVYLAHDGVRNEDVAIKVVDAGPLCSEDAAALLKSELTAHSRIQDYQHILKVYDVHQVAWGGTRLLVLSMEFADGGTLRTWLQEHVLDVETRRTQGVNYFRQLCLGVKAIHDAGMAHLDVKPENALFVGGVLKVADFSVSDVVQSLTRHPAEEAQNDLAPGRIGTPQYMSPEHYKALTRNDLDSRSDIYSLGVVNYEIHDPNGRPPFLGSYANLRELHTSALVPSLPEADETQRRIVTRCLQKHPLARYQDVAELLDDLDGKAQTGASFREEIQGSYEQARQLYAAMERGLETMGLGELIAMLEEAAVIYPEHPAGRVIQVKLRVRAQQYCQAMENGFASARHDDWQAALSYFERATQLNPGAREAEGPVRCARGVLEQISKAREWDRANNSDPKRTWISTYESDYMAEISERIAD